MKNLMHYSEILKHLSRSGWLRKDISNPESVASHSWQMSLMALKLSSEYGEQYDFERITKLCICHDLGESIIGDITPVEKAYEDKAEQERKAVAKLAEITNFSELLSLFDEFETQNTPEAQIAKDLDKIDMYIQALDYSEKYPQKDFSEFLQSAESQVKTALGRKLLEELKA